MIALRSSATLQIVCSASPSLKSKGRLLGGTFRRVTDVKFGNGPIKAPRPRRVSLGLLQRPCRARSLHNGKPGDTVVWEQDRHAEVEDSQQHWGRGQDIHQSGHDVAESQPAPTSAAEGLVKDRSSALESRLIQEGDKQSPLEKSAVSSGESAPSGVNDEVVEGVKTEVASKPSPPSEPAASSDPLKGEVETWGVKVVTEATLAKAVLEARDRLSAANRLLDNESAALHPTANNSPSAKASSAQSYSSDIGQASSSQRASYVLAEYSSDSDGEEASEGHPFSVIGKRKGGLRPVKAAALKMAEGGVKRLKAATSSLDEAKSQALDSTTWSEVLTAASLVALPLLVGAGIFIAVDHFLGTLPPSVSVPATKEAPRTPSTALELLGNWAPFLKEWLGPAAGAAGAAGTFAGLGIGLGASAKAAPVVALLSAKFVPEVESAWRTLGGASLVAIYWRTLVFGKTIRTVEWDLLSGAESPDGALKSLTVRQTSLKVLKQKIASAHDLPGGAKDVQQMALWIPTGGDFFEPLRNARDVALVPDYSYVAWTRVPQSDAPMPFRGGSKSRKKGADVSTPDSSKLLETLTAQPVPVASVPLKQVLRDLELSESSWLETKAAPSAGASPRESDSEVMDSSPAKDSVGASQVSVQEETLLMVVAIAELAAESRRETIEGRSISSSYEVSNGGGYDSSRRGAESTLKEIDSTSRTVLDRSVLLISVDEEDELIELALQGEPALVCLSRAFLSRNPKKFLRHALHHVRRRVDSRS